MKFSFYMVDPQYCDYLKQYDPCIPYTMDQKAIRPFVGIVFSLNGFQYYAPLTSPKPKHLHMKNQADFLKINRGEWGAINFNNMIPVPSECLTKVQMKVLETDSAQDVAYKNLFIEPAFLVQCKPGNHLETGAETLPNYYGRQGMGNPCRALL